MAETSRPRPPTAIERPLSPHLQVWRWHVTMATSILNRATGAALYAGMIGVAIWLIALAAGPDVYAQVQAVLGSLIGQAGLYALTLAAAYHLVGGLRHLFWDAGVGYRPAAADATAWVAILFALLAPLAVWSLANF